MCEFLRSGVRVVGLHPSPLQVDLEVPARGLLGLSRGFRNRRCLGSHLVLHRASGLLGTLLDLLDLLDRKDLLVKMVHLVWLELLDQVVRVRTVQV